MGAFHQCYTYDSVRSLSDGVNSGVSLEGCKVAKKGWSFAYFQRAVTHGVFWVPSQSYLIEEQQQT